MSILKGAFSALVATVLIGLYFAVLLFGLKYLNTFDVYCRYGLLTLFFYLIVFQNEVPKKIMIGLLRKVLSYCEWPYCASIFLRVISVIFGLTAIIILWFWDLSIVYSIACSIFIFLMYDLDRDAIIGEEKDEQ